MIGLNSQPRISDRFETSEHLQYKAIIQTPSQSWEQRPSSSSSLSLRKHSVNSTIWRWIQDPEARKVQTYECMQRGRHQQNSDPLFTPFKKMLDNIFHSDEPPLLLLFEEAEKDSNEIQVWSRDDRSKPGRVPVSKSIFESSWNSGEAKLAHIGEGYSGAFSICFTQQGMGVDHSLILFLTNPSWGFAQ